MTPGRAAPFMPELAGGPAFAPAPTGNPLQTMMSLAQRFLPGGASLPNQMPGMPTAPAPRPNTGSGIGGLAGLEGMIGGLAGPTLPNPVADSPGTLALPPRTMAQANSPPAAMPGFLSLLQGLGGR